MKIERYMLFYYNNRYKKTDYVLIAKNALDHIEKYNRLTIDTQIVKPPNFLLLPYSDFHTKGSIWNYTLSQIYRKALDYYHEKSLPYASFDKDNHPEFFI